jgi:hypothetical protein
MHVRVPTLHLSIYWPQVLPNYVKAWAPVE